jgi:uncharacterized protein (DUF1800 family)
MPVWNRATARHLLSRTLFGYTRKDLDKALSYASLDQFVERELLADLPQPEAPSTWVTETPIANDPNTGVRQRELTAWWYNRMLNEGTSMRERMVLFFHNHFTSQQDKVNYPQYLYIQNALFRKYAFGNLRQLTKDVTVDPAMLIYLDGRNSSKNGPNENYARELMELFTLGIGNYTETDVKQAAKALTGWRVVGLKAEFDANRFDAGTKTVLGKTDKFDYKTLVDHLFAQTACAQFFCRKLYTEFVYYKPDEAFISKMAKVLRDANFELRPVLKFLFTADEFYATPVVASRIKSPSELLVGTLKYLGVSTLVLNDWNYLFDTARSLQQQLFEPPNVAGWPGQRDWISSNTYPQRGGYSDSLVNGRKLNGQNLTLKIKPLDYARTFSSAENAAKFVDDVSELFIQFPLSTQKKKLLLDTLLDGTVVTNWSTYTPMADVRIQKFLRALMRLPEFQLT